MQNILRCADAEVWNPQPSLGTRTHRSYYNENQVGTVKTRLNGPKHRRADKGNFAEMYALNGWSLRDSKQSLLGYGQKR